MSDPACVHSKTVLGCPGCTQRCKNQAARFLRERDALYLAVKQEVDRLRSKSDANRSMVHWAQADRLQEILDKAGEKREVPDYEWAYEEMRAAVARWSRGEPRGEERHVLQRTHVEIAARLSSEQKGADQ